MDRRLSEGENSRVSTQINMTSPNRQCFFITENRYNSWAPTENSLPIEKSLPWKNTRNYMNRMTVSEDDQFEICGLIVVPIGKLTRERKEEKKAIPTQIISKLSRASGIVDVLISGLNLCKYFRIYEGPLGKGMIT